MSVLRRRPVPENRTAVDLADQEDGKPEKRHTRRALLKDDAEYKVTVRLPYGKHKRMKQEAAAQGVPVEQAYQDAIDAYLKTR